MSQCSRVQVEEGCGFFFKLVKPTENILHFATAKALLTHRWVSEGRGCYEGRAAGAGGEGQVSPEEDLATLFHQHRNSDPGFQPGL
jgi:hypothetical protein